MAATGPAPADLLLTGGTVVTLDADRRVLREGAVAVTGGEIADVGPARDLAGRWAPARVLDVTGLVVTPGLVNAHVHLTGPALFPGIEPADSPVADHLPRYVLPAHVAAEPEDEVAAARLSALALLRTGTTAFVEAGVLRWPEAVVPALADLGVRGAVGAWASDGWPLPFAAAGLAPDGLDRGLIRVWPDVVGHDGVSDELFVAAARRAADQDRHWTFHLSALSDDGDRYRERHGADPLVHLDRLGVLDRRAVVAHAIHLSDAEVDVLARTGATVAFCPGAALRLATGVSRAGRHPDLPHVALGTDTVNVSNHHDLLRAAATAADLYGEVRGDRGVLPATRVLEWATLGGARALGLDGRIGSLAVGRRADLAVFDAGPLVRNAANALVHGAPRAVHTIVDGVPLLVDGVVDGEDAIVAEAGAAAERVARRAGLPSSTGWPVSP